MERSNPTTPEYTPAAARSGDRTLFAILLIAGFLIFGVGLVDCLNFSVDDTFIPFRYAENLVAGKGLVFNPGERIEGYSDFLWTLLLSLFVKMGFSQRASDLALLKAAKLAGALFGLGALVVLSWLASRIRGRRPWGGYSGLIGLAVTSTGAAYSFALWSVSGLETSMCAFFVTIAGAAFFAGLQSHRETGKVSAGIFQWGGLAFALAALARPEQIFVWALTLAGLLLFVPRELRKAVVWSAAPVILIYGIFLAWRVSYYGQLLPNTVYAKAGGGVVAWILGFKYAAAGLVATIGCVALGMLALPALLRSGTEWAFLGLYCLAHLLFIALSGGDWMPGHRFFVPVMPLLWTLSIASALSLVVRLSPPVPRAALAGLLGLLAIGTFFDGRFLIRAQMPVPTGLHQRTWNAAPKRIELAHELRQMLPPGRTLAIGECGYIPYYCPELRILDVYGLMDPVISHLPGLQHHKLRADYFLRRRPDYYLMRYQWGGPADDGITMLASPEFRARYHPIKYFEGLARDSLPGRGEVVRQTDETFVLYRRD